MDLYQSEYGKEFILDWIHALKVAVDSVNMQ
jgi:hypothetical protein